MPERSACPTSKMCSVATLVNGAGENFQTPMNPTLGKSELSTSVESPFAVLAQLGAVRQCSFRPDSHAALGADGGVQYWGRCVTAIERTSTHPRLTRRGVD